MGTKSKAPVVVVKSLISVEIDGSPSGTVVDALLNHGEPEEIRGAILDGLISLERANAAAAREDLTKTIDRLNHEAADRETKIMETAEKREAKLTDAANAEIAKLSIALKNEQEERKHDAQKFSGLVAAAAQIPTKDRPEQLQKAIEVATTTLREKTRAALKAQAATIQAQLRSLDDE